MSNKKVDFTFLVEHRITLSSGNFILIFYSISSMCVTIYFTGFYYLNYGSHVVCAYLALRWLCRYAYAKTCEILNFNNFPFKRMFKRGFYLILATYFVNVYSIADVILTLPIANDRIQGVYVRLK